MSKGTFIRTDRGWAVRLFNRPDPGEIVEVVRVDGTATDVQINEVIEGSAGAWVCSFRNITRVPRPTND